jgi:hypothetical protein
MQHPLWREDGSLIYIYCWPSPAQSFSGPSPTGLITIFCCQIRQSPTWRARSPCLYPPGRVGSTYIPRHWVSFSLPPTTRRATVEIFEPTKVKVKIEVCSLLPISSSWRQAPPDPRPEFLFSNWTLAVIVLMYHALWREEGFVSYEYVWPFVNCTFGTYSMLLKNFPFALYTSPLPVQALRSRSCLFYVSYAITAS